MMNAAMNRANRSNSRKVHAECLISLYLVARDVETFEDLDYSEHPKRHVSSVHVCETHLYSSQYETSGVIELARLTGGRVSPI